ncbi:hypothetical protein Q3G72_009132 [Acer saccharum]|nr:hypothetical protein Q3G72_009132 [Acer saccharum]
MYPLTTSNNQFTFSNVKFRFAMASSSTLMVVSSYLHGDLKCLHGTASNTILELQLNHGGGDDGSRRGESENALRRKVDTGATILEKSWRWFKKRKAKECLSKESCCRSNNSQKFAMASSSTLMAVSSYLHGDLKCLHGTASNTILELQLNHGGGDDGSRRGESENALRRKVDTGATILESEKRSQSSEAVAVESLWWWWFKKRRTGECLLEES